MKYLINTISLGWDDAMFILYDLVNWSTDTDCESNGIIENWVIQDLVSKFCLFEWDEWVWLSGTVVHVPKQDEVDTHTVGCLINILGIDSSHGDP